MSELVSIIMPVYNAGPFLQKAIQSILDQSYKNLELLILDDGSSDHSPKIINSVTDERVRNFKFKKNKGNVFAINFLLQQAKGSFIAFQDADDWSDSTRIEKQVDYLNKNKNISLCGTDFNYVTLTGDHPQHEPYPMTHEDIMTYINQCKEPPFCAASCMIRKDVYKAIGGFREYFNRIGAADFDWHLRILNKFHSANISERLYFYTQNINSVTHTITPNLKKMISGKIAFFLYRQRVQSGEDALENGKEIELERFVNDSLPEFIQDKSLIYNKIAMSEIHKGNVAKAFLNVLIGITKSPMHKKNYTLLKYCTWKTFVNKEKSIELVKQV